MANRIEILVEVDPTGKGAGAIRSITANVEQLGKKSGEAGATGRQALDGFAGGLGIPTSIAAATTAIAAGIVAVGVASIKASNEAANAQRVLKSDAQEAGVSLETAKAEAKKFGDDLALSNTEAEKSFSKFLRVLKASGEVDNTAKYQKNITNLIAAYGVAGSEIDTLFGQILSGQDEALNKLGLADPSKIYEAYAKNINKTVEALTAEEKTRSILVALSEKGARFEGAAAERLASAPGQWQELGKVISDTTASLGKFLQTQTLVGDIPTLLKGVLTGRNPLDVLAEETKKKYDAQSEASYQEALRASNARLSQLKDSLGVPEALKNPFGSFDNRVTLLGREGAEKEKKAFIAQYDALFKDKALDKITAQFAERQFKEIRGILDPKKAQEIEREFTKFWDKFAKVALGGLKTARDGASKFYEDVAGRGSGASNPFIKVMIDADNAADNLRKTFGILGDSAVRDLQKIEDSFTRQKLLVLDLDAQLKANSLRREADNLSNPLPGGLSGRDERSLGVFEARLNAATNTASLEAIAKALATGSVGTRTINAEEIIQRSYAAGLGKNFDALTDEDKFFATRGREKEIERLNKANAYFVESGLNISQDDVSRSTIDNLLNLEGFAQKQGGALGDKAKEAFNSALVDTFNGLSPELQASIATGGEGGGVRSSFRDAFTGAAQSIQDKIKDEIAKGAVADRAVAGVRQDIETINRLRREGLSTTDADARLLSVTGGLDPKEITADIKEARIDALRRQADESAKAREDAEKKNNARLASENKLTTAIDNLAGEIRKPQNRKLLIEINNRAKASVRDELYGSLQNEE